MGFEAAYGFNIGTLDANVERDAMQKIFDYTQKDGNNLKSLDILPSFCTGWNHMANFTVDPLNYYPGGTNPYDHFYAIDPKDFEELCVWARDEFIPQFPENSLGRKLNIWDNWNEYTEGHSMMPSQWVGFDYLDTIGRVFTKKKDFADVNIKPTPGQVARMNTQFPMTWNGGHEWNFDSFYNEPEFWKAGKDIKNYRTDGGGYLNFTLEGGSAEESCIQCLGNRQMDAAAAKLMIRLKNGTPLTSAKVYFITDASPEYSEDKCAAFAMRPNDSHYSEYVLDMSSNANWKGLINRLKLVFPQDGVTSGAISIDHIRLGVDGPEPTPKPGEPFGPQRLKFDYTFLLPEAYYMQPVYAE